MPAQRHPAAPPACLLASLTAGAYKKVMQGWPARMKRLSEQSGTGPTGCATAVSTRLKAGWRCREAHTAERRAESSHAVPMAGQFHSSAFSAMSTASAWPLVGWVELALEAPRVQAAAPPHHAAPPCPHLHGPPPI